MSEQLIPTPSEFAKYTLEKELGHGGMGGVYLGHDNMLDRRVAIKVMLKSYGEDATFVERFKKEAQAAAKLSHPNIAQIYEFDLFEGQPYISMELVSGGSLDKKMEKNPGQLDPGFVMKVGLQIADGLGAAADRGLVHGDVKPENILFSADGTAKLVDFGLAAMQGDTGEIWGTPYYISPEKVRRQKIDFRADIYSLGGTLYHALTGVAPYEGTDAAEVVKARFDGPPRKPSEVRPGIPEKIDEIIMRMLETEPSKRYPTYESLKGDISRFLEKSGLKKTGNQASGRKIVIKGRGGHAMIAPTGSLSPVETHAGVPRPPIPQPPPPPKNIGAMVGAVVGGVILLIVVVALLLVWFVHSSRAKEAAMFQRDVVDKQAQARASIEKTMKNAADFMADLEAFCGEAVKTVEDTTDQLEKMLSDRGVTRAMLVPGPTQELLEAINSAAAPKPAAEPEPQPAPAAQESPKPAANEPAGQSAPKKIVRVHAEYDPNSPEAQEEAAKKAEEEKKVAEEKKAAEAPQQAAEPAGEQAPAAEELPPVAKAAITRLRELWADAYACSAAVITVRAKISELDAYKAKADALTMQDEPTSQALAKLSRDVAEAYSQTKSLPAVGNAQRKKGVIKTKSQNIVDQTRKELTTVQKQKDAEARRLKEEEERKEREAREAEEHKKLVETEVALVESRYAAYKSSLLRSLSCQPAITQLEGLRNGVGGVTTKEAKERIDAYVNGLKYMKGLLEYFEKSVKNFTLSNGTVLNAAKGGKVDILPKGAKKKTTLDWYAYFNKDQKGFNSLIKELVERREKQKLSLIAWSQHMMGSALVLKTLFGDNDGAVKRAESLVVEAVKGYPDCSKKAQGVFPEINIEAAASAADSDGDL